MMASKLQNRTQMAPWAQRNCFRRRMIVEDIRFGWILHRWKFYVACFYIVVESLHVHGKMELCEMQRPSNFAEFFEYKSWESFPFVKCTQLSGRLFNPSDICKNLSHTFYCIFQLVFGTMGRARVSHRELKIRWSYRSFRWAPLKAENWSFYYIHSTKLWGIIK